MKNYYKSLLAGICLILGFIATFNWLVNPYDIFSSPEINGFNQYKSEVGRHTRLSKAYKVNRVRPDTILLASSRGLNIPESYFTDVGHIGMNLALASASTYELLRMLQHVQAISPLEKVVLALDESFSDTRQPNFSEKRLEVDFDGTKNIELFSAKAQDMFFSLLSVDSLRSSIRTIKKQKENPALKGYEKYKAERVYQAGGHHQMFRTMEASVFSHYRGLHDCTAAITEDCDLKRQTRAYFERIVEISYANNIELIIYISPVHARYYEALRLVNRWDAIEDMKRFVVNTVENKAMENNSIPFVIWDFSGYNDITTEALPDMGDKVSAMHWYWEGSHYTKETSELIFDRIFEKTMSELEGFGIKLNSANIDKHLRNIKNKRDIYLKTHALDSAELNSLFNSGQH